MAEDYTVLVNQMWHSDPHAPPTVEEWMEEQARQAEIWNNIWLRIDSPAHFVEDMLATGLLALPEEQPM